MLRYTHNYITNPTLPMQSVGAVYVVETQLLTPPISLNRPLLLESINSDSHNILSLNAISHTQYRDRYRCANASGTSFLLYTHT